MLRGGFPDDGVLAMGKLPAPELSVRGNTAGDFRPPLGGLGRARVRAPPPPSVDPPWPKVATRGVFKAPFSPLGIRVAAAGVGVVGGVSEAAEVGRGRRDGGGRPRGVVDGGGLGGSPDGGEALFWDIAGGGV